MKDVHENAAKDARIAELEAMVATMARAFDSHDVISDQHNDIARLGGQLRVKDARIAELEAKLAQLTTCWHCGDVLDAPALNCGNCPVEGDCDDCDCPHPGCAEDVAAFRGEVSRG